MVKVRAAVKLLIVDIWVLPIDMTGWSPQKHEYKRECLQFYNTSDSIAKMSCIWWQVQYSFMAGM